MSACRGMHASARRRRRKILSLHLKLVSGWPDPTPNMSSALAANACNTLRRVTHRLSALNGSINVLMRAVLEARTHPHYWCTPQAHLQLQTSKYSAPILADLLPYGNLDSDSDSNLLGAPSNASDGEDNYADEDFRWPVLDLEHSEPAYFLFSSDSEADVRGTPVSALTSGRFRTTG
ncbi:hypothetical protein C8J57DRAFT_1235184 [Mycena rebaudengoi]|nr:hypothetical protein C8J57DRAFT_1235184 [Mycena rebaudengoi]